MLSRARETAAADLFISSALVMATRWQAESACTAWLSPSTQIESESPRFHTACSRRVQLTAHTVRVAPLLA